MPPTGSETGPTEVWRGLPRKCRHCEWVKEKHVGSETCDFSLELPRWSRDGQMEDGQMGTGDVENVRARDLGSRLPRPSPDPYLHTQRQATSLAASSGTGQVGKTGLSRYVAKTSATIYCEEGRMMSSSIQSFRKAGREP